MNADEFRNKIKSIMFSDKPYGLEVYACVRYDQKFKAKRFIINDELREMIAQTLEGTVESKYLKADLEVDSSDNIADNKNILYEVVQTDSYFPFSFIKGVKDDEIYSRADEESLQGFCFKLNINENEIFLYQNIYKMRMIQKGKNILAKLGGNQTYVPYKDEILGIDSRVDIVLIENSIFTEKIAMLQKQFKFEQYIRLEASKTIEVIMGMEILSNTAKLLSFSEKEKLTNAKKLLKARNSPVLKMDKSRLLARLQNHPRYQDKFQIQQGEIIITSEKMVGEFIKMLNDDIVRSELTDQEYDSISKHLLDPIPAVIN